MTGLLKRCRDRLTHGKKQNKGEQVAKELLHQTAIRRERGLGSSFFDEHILFHITRICTGNLKIFKFYKAFTNVIVILHKRNKGRF